MESSIQQILGSAESISKQTAPLGAQIQQQQQRPQLLRAPASVMKNIKNNF